MPKTIDSSKTSNSRHTSYIAPTRQWVEQVVVGHNFCPFARREIEANTVRYTVIEEAGLELLFKALEEECQRLDSDCQVETTLIILASGAESFFDFLDLLAQANDWLTDNRYEGIYQLASFHPDYCFADSRDDDPANYTNRSPFPTLHLIREDSMEQALARHPDPDGIPQRNIELARQLGKETLAKALADCLSTSPTAHNHNK